MEAVETYDIIHKSERKISFLTEIYDWIVALISFLCMVLFIVIIVRLFLLNELAYAIILASFMFISIISIFCQSAILFRRKDLDHNHCYWVITYCCILFTFPFLMPFTQFLLFKGTNNSDAEDENDAEYPQWKWIEQRIELHSGHFIQHLTQILPQLIILIIFIIHNENDNYLDSFGDLKIIIQITILLSLIAFCLILFIIVVNELNSTFTTAIFFWFCIITDIVGFFLIIFFAFSNLDQFFILNPENHFFYKLLALNGNLNLFGQLWILNWLICTVPITILGIMVFYVLLFIHDEWSIFSNEDALKWCFPCVILLGIILGAALGIIASLLAQFVTFALFIVVINVMLLSRFNMIDDPWDKRVKNVWSSYGWDSSHLQHSLTCSITSMLNFIQDTNDEDLIRLICVNYALYEVVPDDKMRHSINELNKHKEEGTLHEIDYKDLRYFSGEPIRSNLIKYIWQLYTINLSDYKLQIQLEIESGDIWLARLHRIQVIAGTILLFFFIPLWFIGKIIIFFYGWIFLGIITRYHDEYSVSMLQLVLLITYLVLQILVIIIFYFFYVQQYILWHIACGVESIDMTCTPFQFVARLNANYNEIEWLPAVKDALVEKFGPDVGALIFKYTTTMIISVSNEKRRKSKAIEGKVIHASGVSYQYGSLFAD